MRLDSVHIGQTHQTNYTQRYALCNKHNTTLYIKYINPGEIVSPEDNADRWQ